MNKRYDVLTPRQGKEKTRWHRVGSAFEDDKGVTVYLDSSPYPDAEGRVVLKLFEPREPQQPNTGGGNQRGANATRNTYDDLDAPF
jgi:hypothetical protein